MTKAEAAAKYLNENTQCLKALPEPSAIAIVGALEDDDDTEWRRAIRTTTNHRWPRPTG